MLLELDLRAERKEWQCEHWGGVEEKLHFFLTLVLGGCGWWTPRPGSCNLGGPQGRSGLVARRESLLPPPGFNPRTVQPITAVVRYAKNCLLCCTRRI